MNVALVADWLVTFGGAEHVLQDLRYVFPDAPLFTTVSRGHRLGPLREVDIRASNLQRWYRLLRQHQLLLPWMPRAVEQLDVRGFDVILSSSHAVAKGIVPESRTLHVCYCHTPMRYAWEMEERYLEDFGVPRALRPVVRRQLRRIRRWDLTTAKRVDLFIANSLNTQERIARIYDRESIVIPPPVDDRFFEVPLRGTSYGLWAMSDERKEHFFQNARSSRLETQSYFLAVGRLVPYKRFDLLIEAANALRLKLRIAGVGQDAQRLKRLAGPTVTFLGYVPDIAMPTLYSGASALLFPQEEDAGIVLLEALACGTPVIAYRAGGSIDAMEEGRTGIFFATQTLSALTEALAEFRKQSWDRAAIRCRAERFRRSTFQQAILSTVEEAWQAFRERRTMGA